ncbi:MobH family relaxase [Marinobacter sp. P4B1]|uniref:MobH family relaxase n=1 Tax=Marinobacter sp. P4B1 TaxID=1119533 RepID=UPI0011A2460D|nr:MobH family relaxase [Marinobacter sp. P4B1]
MIKWLTSLFSKNGQLRGSGADAKLKFEPGGLAAMGDIPRYPPFHEGLPNATPKQLLATQERLIKQIKHELALPESDYQTLIPPLLEAFAAYVHLLPASKNHHHRGAGGMLRHGLEVGLIATRRFHSKIIDGHETGQRRKVLEPRWRLAVFIAGITHDIGKSAYDVSVTDISGRLKWDVYTQTLHEFLTTNKLDRYFVGWRKNREHKIHEKFSHLLTMKVVPPHVFSWLNDGDPRIISAIHETISGHQPKGSARVMYELVMQADQTSVAEDVKGQKISEGEDSVAVPVPKYLLDAMKRLIESDQWRANKEGQPLWVTKQGIFLEWDKAVKDIVNLLEKDGTRGIPKSRSTIAESLADFDLIKLHEDGEGNQTYYRHIAPEPLEKHGIDLTVLTVVEINGEGVLFDDIAPAKVAVAVGEAGIQARKEELEQAKLEEKEARKNKPSPLKEKLLKQGVSVPVLESTENQDKAASTDEPAPAKPSTEQEERSDSQTPESEVDSQKRHGDNDGSQTGKESEAIDQGPSSEWLNAYGDKGDVLKACFVPGPNSQAMFVDDEILLPYPAGMEIYGDAKSEKLALITDLLKKDSMLSAKAVQKRKVGKKTLSVLVIGGELAKKLAELGTAQEREDTPPSAPEPKPTSSKQTAKPDPKPAPHRPQPEPEAPVAENESAPTGDDSPEKSKPKANPPAKEKPAAKPKGGQKAAPKARKRAAKKDTPPPMPKSLADKKPARSPVIDTMMASFRDVKPEIKKVDGEGGIWIHQNDGLAWYQSEVDSSSSYLSLISALRRTDVQTKTIDKETYLFVPDSEV